VLVPFFAPLVIMAWVHVIAVIGLVLLVPGCSTLRLARCLASDERSQIRWQVKQRPNKNTPISETENGCIVSILWLIQAGLKRINIFKHYPA
jgi:hypothetical protein